MSTDYFSIYLCLFQFLLSVSYSFHCMGLSPHWLSLFLGISFFLDLMYLFIYLFIYWLCWVFVTARGLSLVEASGLSLVAASGGYSLLQCEGFSLPWLLLLQSTGFSSCGTWASVVVTRRL